MLPKRSRIARSDFAPLLSSRQFKHSPHFSLRYALGGDAKTAKVAVSVSKKVAKSAVARNTVRRRAYAALSPLLPSLSPGRFLLVAKAGAVGVKGESLERELKELLKAL